MAENDDGFEIQLTVFLCLALFVVLMIGICFCCGGYQWCIRCWYAQVHTRPPPIVVPPDLR